jgi:hypothetical protein
MKLERLEKQILKQMDETFDKQDKICRAKITFRTTADELRIVVNRNNNYYLKYLMHFLLPLFCFKNIYI